MQHCTLCDVILCKTTSNIIFIELIHPTNGQLLYRSARPVPPNVRKRRLVKLPAGPVIECAFARWCKVYHFLSGHNDVIASFSFGAKECADVFHQRYVFEVLQRTLPFYFISSSTNYFC